MYLNSIGSELKIPELGDIVSLKAPEDDDFKFMSDTCTVIAIGKNNAFVDIANLFHNWKTSASLSDVYFVRRFRPIHGEGYYANCNMRPQRGDIITLNIGVLDCIPENRLIELKVDAVFDDPAWIKIDDGHSSRNTSITHLYNLIERKEHVYQL